jgi:hypothetical protein
MQKILNCIKQFANYCEVQENAKLFYRKDHKENYTKSTEKIYFKILRLYFCPLLLKLRWPGKTAGSGRAVN